MKLSFKEPKVGGAFAWHQGIFSLHSPLKIYECINKDYGYWYQNGCIFPYMASCFVALDPCTRENGCIQIIKVAIQHIKSYL